jgi:hypothetical protein
MGFRQLYQETLTLSRRRLLRARRIGLTPYQLFLDDAEELNGLRMSWSSAF